MRCGAAKPHGRREYPSAQLLGAEYSAIRLAAGFAASLGRLIERGLKLQTKEEKGYGGGGIRESDRHTASTSRGRARCPTERAGSGRQQALSRHQAR